MVNRIGNFMADNAVMQVDDLPNPESEEGVNYLGHNIKAVPQDDIFGPEDAGIDSYSSLSERSAESFNTPGEAYLRLISQQINDAMFFEYVFAEYNRNPHAIYWINLMVSVLNFRRRLGDDTPYDAFSQISLN